MENVKKITGFVLVALWILLFLLLTVRFPVADMLSESVASMMIEDASAVLIDKILSFTLIGIGIASGVLGVLLKRRELVTLSVCQAGFLLVSALLCGLAFITLNDVFLKYMLYVLNPFTAMLYLPVFWALVFVMAAILIPAISFFIYKIKVE